MKITLQEVADRIKKANKILLTAHTSPDGDAIGSTLAMLQILREMGKQPQIFIDDKLPRNFSVLPYEEEISRPFEGERLDADLLVILDTAPDRIGKVETMTDAPILNIDHHITNKGEIGEVYVEPTAAATCEIIYKLCKELGVEISKNIAVCLYSGIATDTGFFNYSNTRPATLRAVADLVEIGVEPNIIAEQFEKRTFRDVKVMSAALQTTKMFYGGKVVGMFIDSKFAKKVDTTEGFIDLIRVIDSVEVAFLLTCKGDKFCRVSMRSKEADVSEIARRLGGGGHIRAAGCSIMKSFEESKKMLVEAIGNYLFEIDYILEEDFEDKREIALNDFEISPLNEVVVSAGN